MSLYISTRAELIKTKRSASFWLSLAGAAFIPVIFFLIYVLKPEKSYEKFARAPWDLHFLQGWQSFTAFLLPMFVILICSQLPQIEYRNNTWKQVFASPQTIGNIFFSKLAAILLLVIFLFVMFNLFMIGVGVSADLLLPKYRFLESPIHWGILLKLNVKTFISLLGIIAIQYWLGLRFRNFIVPIGIGLALLITAMIISPWEHIDKMPYAFPYLTFATGMGESQALQGGFSLKNHELNSMAWFAGFTLLAFLDMRFRKERG